MENQRHPIEVPELRNQKKWWFQDSGLRRLYLLIFIAVLSAATNGYDGSMMNGLQALTYWKTCELIVTEERAGLTQRTRLQQPRWSQAGTPQCHPVRRLSLLSPHRTQSCGLDRSTEEHPGRQSGRCTRRWAAVRCKRHWHVHRWQILQ